MSNFDKVKDVIMDKLGVEDDKITLEASSLTTSVPILSILSS